MPKLKVSDVSLFYEIQGQGQPLVLIPGFIGDHRIWQNVIEGYAKRYQVITIDNRGIGQSDCPDYPYTIEMMAEDIMALCEALQISSANFMGVSMGGTIVQMIARQFPEKVNTAIIENSFMQIDIRFALFAQARYELLKAGAPLQSLIKSALPWSFSSNILKQDNFVESYIELGLSNPYPVTAQGYKHQLNALLTFNSNNWIQNIKSPCLVIGSDQDMIVSESHMQQLAKQIPHAKYYGFKNCGHLPHIEQPELFNQVVLDFLDSTTKN